MILNTTYLILILFPTFELSGTAATLCRQRSGGEPTGQCQVLRKHAGRDVCRGA